MWEDPIVAEVRRAREQLAARFDFDVEAIFADIQNRQTALGRRLVSRTQPANPQGADRSRATQEPASSPRIPKR
jgi:hypothetical protein